MSNASEYPARGPSGYRSTRRFVAMALAAVLLVLLPAAISAAQGAASDWARNDQTAVRLVSAVAGVGDLDAVPLGLQFTLKPGWKTYWRSPGDAGIPVTVDWTGSENLASADMAWPVPHRFTLFGLETFGYEREVVFPITVHPARAGEPIRLRAAVNYLVCEQICIPHQAVLALDLPAGPASPTGHGQLIDRFADQVPGDGAAHDLRLGRIGLAGGPEAPMLEVVAQSGIPFAAPDLIVEGPPGLYFAAPEVTLSDGGTRAVLRVPVTREEGAPALADASLTMTLVDGTRGLERDVTPGLAAGLSEPLSPIASPTTSSAALLPMLAVALLGGLILNLMPCVLPVLSLKLLGVVGHGGGAARAVRASFLASAAGVLVSFLALAGVLASLKMAGVAVGWGIQFQQPLFLVAMILMLTLFACNLWGWFEVPLPGWLGGVVGGRPGASEGHGLGGHFVTGAFATLLATPCSAPFLGTAVGFALARGGAEIFAIFAALGLGLAAPYLLVAAVPSLATRLPRPGRWMITLRRVLAFALAGTALWLLSVLAAQISAAAALLVGGLMLAVAGMLWARRRLPDGFRLATPAAVGLLALAAFLLPLEMSERPAAAEAEAGEGLWQPFEAAQIAGLVASGKSVFVDVTADWCITCQVNKRMVLGDADVAERLAGKSVVAMRADWTRPDDAIAAYLASFGRYGIPFNVVYGPGAPEGVPLPELLTESAVLDAIDRAAGRAGG